MRNQILTNAAASRVKRGVKNKRIHGIFLKRVKQNKFDELYTTKLSTASLLENMKTCYALFQEMNDTCLHTLNSPSNK